MPIVEIISSNDFYDYNAKYTKGLSRYICPADIDKDLSDCIKNDSLKLFDLLGCEKYARVDYRLDSQKYFLLELNTHPGMTDTSLLPMAAKEQGISFDQLVKKLINKLKN